MREYARPTLITTVITRQNHSRTTGPVLYCGGFTKFDTVPSGALDAGPSR